MTWRWSLNKRRVTFRGMVMKSWPVTVLRQREKTKRNTTLNRATWAKFVAHFEEERRKLLPSSLKCSWFGLVWKHEMSWKSEERRVEIGHIFSESEHAHRFQKNASFLWCFPSRLPQGGKNRVAGVFPVKSELFRWNKNKHNVSKELYSSLSSASSDKPEEKSQKSYLSLHASAAGC